MDEKKTYVAYSIIEFEAKFASKKKRGLDEIIMIHKATLLPFAFKWANVHNNIFFKFLISRMVSFIELNWNKFCEITVN